MIGMSAICPLICLSCAGSVTSSVVVLGLEMSSRTNFESLALKVKSLALALSKSPWPWPNRSLALQDL